MYLPNPISIKTLKRLQTLRLLDGRSCIIQEPQHFLKIHPISFFQLREIVVHISQEELVPQSDVVAKFEELQTFQLFSVLGIGVEDVLQLIDVLFISYGKVGHLLLSTLNRTIIPITAEKHYLMYIIRKTWSQMLNCKLHSYIPRFLLQKLPQLSLFLHLDEPRIMRNWDSSTIEITPPQSDKAALYSQLLAEHTWPQILAFIGAEFAFCRGCYSQNREDTEAVAYLHVFSEIYAFLIGATADHTQTDVIRIFFLPFPLSRNICFNNPEIFHLILQQS